MQLALHSIARQKIARLGIHTVEDLLRYMPHRYNDFSRVVMARNLQPGDTVAVEGVLEGVKIVHTWKRHMQLVEAHVVDQSGRVRAVWFNQAYLVRTLKNSARIALFGKVYENRNGIYFANPAYQFAVGNELAGFARSGQAAMRAAPPFARGLVPVYREVAGASSRWLQSLVGQYIYVAAQMADVLPEDICMREKFPSIAEAMRMAHFPKSQQEADAARARFQFEELFLLQARFLLQRSRLQQMRARAIPFNQQLLKQFFDTLPYTLTDGQRKAAWQLLQDIAKPYPMQRLLEGDVGSGKTIVAFMGVLEVAQAGYQSALMAPTEVLARQHFISAGRVLCGHGVTVGLATATAHMIAAKSGGNKILEKKITKKTFQKLLGEGAIQFAVGTHALIARGMEWHDLALAIADEQHRFGVKQRTTLARYGQARGTSPHFLSMSATPIPRTLALAVYGDLDISRIVEMPAGRKPIETRVVLPSRRGEAYAFIRSEIQKGRQAFVICPRIEPGGLDTNSQPIDLVQSKRPTSTPQQSAAGGWKLQARLAWIDVRAVKQEYEKLSKTIFSDLRVGMLHGKLKPKEKEAVMKKFSDGKLDILVSTSVVEVGIDVPNATIMAIEGADRFGLATLHQFRGRVGRGMYMSYCLLLSDSAGAEANARLKALVRSHSGFELAQIDLELRGPGQFMGQEQSGLPDVAMEALKNPERIEQVRDYVQALLLEDPALEMHSALRERLAKITELVHGE